MGSSSESNGGEWQPEREETLGKMFMGDAINGGQEYHRSVIRSYTTYPVFHSPVKLSRCLPGAADMAEMVKKCIFFQQILGQATSKPSLCERF